MNFYRCLICGEVYMGTAAPSHCPFCGAASKYLVPASEWVDGNVALEELSDASTRNLKAALQLEANNAPFYRDAMSKADSTEMQGIFKYIFKIEREHASVIQKILKAEMPPPQPGKEVASDNTEENLRAAHEREQAAVKFYRHSAEVAVEPRVREVFTALSDIESDHVALEGERLEGNQER